MNNLKYYSDNLAHDFDMFMPKEKAAPIPKQTPKVIKMPQPKVKAKTAGVALSGRIFTIVMTIFIACAVIGNLFLRAEISKASNELNAAEAISEQLANEKTRLGVEVEKKTSIGNLEKQAQKLGMQKQEKSQVHYIFAEVEAPQEESAEAE